ncbi:MAG: diguanylate cyclase, partial [Pseudomonadota bacterium]
EASLKESQERYMLASMAVHDGLWDWNLATDKVYFSPTWKALLGFMDDEIRGDPEEWFRRLHPDDEERVREGIAKLRGGFLSRFEGEYRIRHKDGSYRWMLCRGISAGGANGETQRLCGSHHDVTKRKQAEQSMRLVEESMRLLVSTTAEGMVVVGGDGAVLFSNMAAKGLLERKGETLDGKPFEFDVEPDIKKKVEIIRGKEVVAIVEMRTAGVRWEGMDALLVTVRDITDFVRMQEEISALALLDELTSLYNRRAFIMMAQQQLRLAERAARDMFLLFIDVDNLKGINDSHGHRNGDMALIETAKILRSTFRRSDIIARVGGDEFVVLAVEARRDCGELLQGRLQQAVDAFNDRAGRPYGLSLSVGVAKYDPAAPGDIDELMAQAGKAMYQDKRARKSRP